MPQLNIELPELEKSDLSSAREIKKLRDYMYVLTEQLSYTLSHLDENNLGVKLNESISASVQKSGDAITGLEECRSAIEKSNESISLKVQKGEIISEINQSAEEVKIQAERISLEGVVTANDGFRINTDGSMEATAGSFGGFSVDAAGNLAGAATLQVGGITLSDKRAAGLLVNADNLDYVYGQPSGSSGAYFLGISDTGRLCLFDMAISNGQLVISTPGSVPQSSATNVLRIRSQGEGLNKRAYPNTGSSTLGTCSSGEVYGYTTTSTDAGGYLWAYCNKKYSYDAAAAIWTGADTGAFWIRQSNDDKSRSYFDFTTVNT